MPCGHFRIPFDDERVHIAHSPYWTDPNVIGVSQFFGADYLTPVHARTSRRYSVAGESGRPIGFYTFAVFRTREEAEAFDKREYRWIDDPDRGGLQIAYLR